MPTAIIAGQKLIVYVTVVVCGVPHTDVGEAATVGKSENAGENAATESWAQAFKRACSQFGLGRYLYDLEKAWVPYNVQRKQINLSETEIQSVVRKMYSDAGINGNTPQTAPQPAPEPAAQSASNGQQAAAPRPQSAKVETDARPQGSDRITASQLKSIQNLCKLLGREVAPGTDVLAMQTAREEIAILSKQWKAKQFKDAQKAS